MRNPRAVAVALPAVDAYRRTRSAPSGVSAQRPGPPRFRRPLGHSIAGLLVTEDEVLRFVQKSIKSVWALEMLLLLRRERDRVWRSGDLVRELRSSDSAVGEAAASLRGAGFASAESGDAVRYDPASPELDAMAARVQAIYAEKPLAVAKAIMSAPGDKLRIFADAFKLKDS